MQKTYSSQFDRTSVVEKANRVGRDGLSGNLNLWNAAISELEGSESEFEGRTAWFWRPCLITKSSDAMMAQAAPSEVGQHIARVSCRKRKASAKSEDHRPKNAHCR